MKKIIVILLIVLLTGCKAKMVYVPVESVRTEYKDKYLRDSIYLHDSILIKMKGDTVFFEKYRYLYKDKIIRDSIFRTDSVQVPYPVTEYKEVIKVTGWQHFQIWCGRILLLVIVSCLIFKYIRRYI